LKAAWRLLERPGPVAGTERRVPALLQGKRTAARGTISGGRSRHQTSWKEPRRLTQHGGTYRPQAERRLPRPRNATSTSFGRTKRGLTEVRHHPEVVGVPSIDRCTVGDLVVVRSTAVSRCQPSQLMDIQSSVYGYGVLSISRSLTGHAGVGRHALPDRCRFPFASISRRT
jgi:hypothetical protein